MISEKQLREILSRYFDSIRELLDMVNNHEKWRLLYQYMRKIIEAHIDEPAENILNYLTKSQIKVLQQALEDLGYTRDMLAEEQEEESGKTELNTGIAVIDNSNSTVVNKNDENSQSQSLRADKQFTVFNRERRVNFDRIRAAIRGHRIARECLSIMSDCVRQKGLDKILVETEDRKHVIEDLTRLFFRTEKKSAILIGKPGVGKSALVERFSLDAEKLGKLIVEFDFLALRELAIKEVSRNPASGGVIVVLPVLFKELIEFIKRHNEYIVLFIDEIHMLASITNDNLWDVLKPSLARAELSIIGATTTEEYARLIRDKAIRRRFEEIVVPEPSKEVVLQILEKRMEHYEQSRNVRYDRDDTDKIRNWVYKNSQQFRNTAHPDCDIEVLDKVTAEYEKRYLIDKQELNFQLFRQLAFEIYRQQTIDSYDSLREIRSKLKTIIPTQHIDKLTRKLAEKLLVRVRKPLVMLFYGDTGTGKTYAAQKLGEILNRKVIYINMEKFSQPHTVLALFGAPPSYIGFGEPTIVDRLKEHPNAIVILDEIEKAHPAVYRTLLNGFDTGILQDNKGDDIAINQVIWILTSNIGTSEARKQEIGLIQKDEEEKVKEFFEPKIYREYLKKYFGMPEFVNRIDLLIPFIPEKAEIFIRLPNMLAELFKQFETLEHIYINEELLYYLIAKTEQEEKHVNFRAVKRYLDDILNQTIEVMLSKEVVEPKEITLAIGNTDKQPKLVDIKPKENRNKLMEELKFDKQKFEQWLNKIEKDEQLEYLVDVK